MTYDLAFVMIEFAYACGLAEIPTTCPGKVCRAVGCRAVGFRICSERLFCPMGCCKIHRRPRLRLLFLLHHSGLLI
jgi:hypothetical protein